MYSKIILGILLFPFILSFASCGYYSFSGSSLVGIETVYVPIFGNATTEFGLEEQLTDAMVAAINAERNLNIGERGNSDAVLEGRITRVQDTPLVYTEGEQVTEYKVEIFVHVKFEDVNNNKIIMEDGFSAWGEYPFPETADGNRQNGIQKALGKIAEDIINKAISGW
ncbi:MAG: LptE family protein [candidate division Zixibacteria bacterium]|nr:LptE family protein [Candidatus Tariuqbacter arcticus]